MKTAISIPDHIFDAAEAMARQLGISRSELYTTAVTKFLESLDDHAITEALNLVYGQEAQEPPDPIMYAIQYETLAEDEWE